MLKVDDQAFGQLSCLLVRWPVRLWNEQNSLAVRLFRIEMFELLAVPNLFSILFNCTAWILKFRFQGGFVYFWWTSGSSRRNKPDSFGKIQNFWKPQKVPIEAIKTFSWCFRFLIGESSVKHSGLCGFCRPAISAGSSAETLCRVSSETTCARLHQKSIWEINTINFSSVNRVSFIMQPFISLPTRCRTHPRHREAFWPKSTTDEPVAGFLVNLQRFRNVGLPNSIKRFNLNRFEHS